MIRIPNARGRRAFFRILSSSTALLAFGFGTSTAHGAGNTAPTIGGGPAKYATVGTAYSFKPYASDADGDTLKFTVSGKPGWMWFNSKTGRLAGTPTRFQAGRTFSNITIRVTDGVATRSLAPFSIRVRWNAPPKIWGTPKTAAYVGSSYYFRPRAADANGHRLTYSIVGKPGWLSFSKRNGSIWGTPTATNVGAFTGISIRVSDGRVVRKLPAFSITVRRVTNRAPTISGSPPGSAKVGQPYAFKPAAYDADQDPLRFAISGKPVWASFEATTGVLHGTPTSANLGSFSNIVMSVTDGKATARLAPFSIAVSSGTTKSVTLNWAKPTTNMDGTPLTNLAGYTVYYGTQSRTYPKSVRVGAATTSVVLEGLSAGRWYFSIRSRNTAGVSSDYSGEVSVLL